MESVADWQKYRFVGRRQGKEFLKTGPWSISRHPNYFGEILLWFGVWLSSSNGLWQMSVAAAILGLASPLLTFLLLGFVSGIPIAEKKDAKRQVGHEEYRVYLEGTSPLWPMPFYRHLPSWLKHTIFLDKPYYLATSSPKMS